MVRRGGAEAEINSVAPPRSLYIYITKNTSMKTIPAMFQESVIRFGSNPMMYQYGLQGYEALSYQEMSVQVNRFANGLLSLGLQKGDRTILLSEGRNDWVMAELAVLTAGGINVPVSIKIDEPEELKFRIIHSGAKFVIVSGRHARKIIPLADQLPEVSAFILLDKIEESLAKMVYRDDVTELGKAFEASNPGVLQKITQELVPGDLANICYTSGTTADPKGIMLSHGNYYTNVEQAGGLFDIPPYYTSVLILPWDHSFAHTAGIYALMRNGASMAAINIGKSPLEALKNIPINIKENQPHFLLSVPALAKNFRKNIEKGVESKGKILKRVFDHGIHLSTEIHGNGFNTTKTRCRAWKKFKLSLIDKVIYRKVRENFGGRLKFFVGGGALLDIDLQYFFYALGIPMYQGYGLTEAAPIISSNTPAKHKLGSSGAVVQDLEIRICGPDGGLMPVGETGEIVVRGGNVMIGYWKNEDASREALRDGWLHTGDMGYLDDEGFLYVMGRFKSLLIGSDGEKYSPEGIEEALVEKCPMIEQVMLINNQHPFTSALVVLNKQRCKSLIQASGKSGEEAARLVLAEVKRELGVFIEGGSCSSWFPQRWIPSALAIADEEFSETNHMINSTMKMVRGKISEHFAEQLAHLYTPEGKELFNEKNLSALKKYLG
jgi:long-chain acyl-CoA synthetase